MTTPKYAALETIVNGKIARIQRHIVQLNHDKVNLRAVNKPFEPRHDTTRHPKGGKNHLATIKVGFMLPWHKRNLSTRSLSDPLLSPEEFKTSLKSIETQITLRKLEIEVVKEVLTKVEQLPEERRVGALLSFIDLYKDCQEPILTCPTSATKPAVRRTKSGTYVKGGF